MNKPEINRTIEALFINPYERTLKIVKIQGIFEAYEILSARQLVAVRSPWGHSDMEPETLLLNGELQEARIPTNHNELRWGFAHKLIHPQIQFPYVGSGLIFRSIKGEDYSTALTPEYVGGLIQFFEWKVQKQHNSPNFN